jgi:hypothetical protein|tara:strand:- start:1078 stop:1251 length:174 start_codon:yes stop_codon:yes gene_type:complete
VVAKSNLTWWEKQRKLVKGELSEMLVTLDDMKLPKIKYASFSIKQKQIEELRKKLKI